MKAMKQIAIAALAVFVCTGDLLAQESASNQNSNPGAQLPGESLMLHLPGGGVAVGYLLEHDVTGLRFQVARHGGVVQLPWEQLHNKQSESLRKRFGYIAEEAEELLIGVQRLVLVTGQEVIGVILDKEGQNFLVKSGGNTQVVPKNRVVSINDGGQVPALEVYKTAELYTQGLAQLSPASAESQIQLAEYCESILDFPHAVLHYTAAVALRKGSEDTGPWQLAAERAGVKALQADQLERLREIDRLRRRSLFPQALEKLAAFRATYADSPLIAEANKSEALIIKTQKRVTQETAVKRWYYRATQLSRELARNTEGGFDAVLARMDGEFANSLRVAVTRDLQSLAPGIEEASVEDLFREAKRRRYRAATYGSGTWLLGSDRAQAGLDDSKQKDPRKAQGSAQPDSAETEFQKRVQAYLDNQRRQARASQRGNADEQAGRDFTWISMSLDARAMWLLAYYAEFGGVFEAQPGIAHLCRQCGGSGALESLNAGLPQNAGGRGGVSGASGPRIERCTLCHGEQIVRRVRYR